MHRPRLLFIVHNSAKRLNYRSQDFIQEFTSEGIGKIQESMRQRRQVWRALKARGFQASQFQASKETSDVKGVRRAGGVSLSAAD